MTLVILIQKANPGRERTIFFNMNSKVLEKLDSRKRQGSIQQRLQEIEIRDAGVIKSDIIPQLEESKEKIKKTVHIELIDVDMNESNEASQSRNRDVEDKPEVESSDTSESQPVKEKMIIENSQLDLEDKDNKFKIKNFELAKDFMKGRQCGRENTPSRSTLSKEEMSNLNKIGSNFNQFNINSKKKAWDEDDQQTSNFSIDRVESFDNSKVKKITQISRKESINILDVQLKQFNPKVKVVRVQSSRRSNNQKETKRISKRRNPAHHAFNLTNNKDEITNSSSGKLGKSGKKISKKDMPPLPISRAKSNPPSVFLILNNPSVAKLEKIYSKNLLKLALSKWKNQTISNDSEDQSNRIKNKEEKKTSQSESPSKHKKKVSEMIQKPFSLLLLNNSSIKHQVSPSKQIANFSLGVENIGYSHQECKEESESPHNRGTREHDVKTWTRDSEVNREENERSPKKKKIDRFNANKLKQSTTSTLKVLLFW